MPLSHTGKYALFKVLRFFLYYPLAEGAWRAVPSQLDSIPHEFSKASYVLDGKNDIYWSAVDKAGIRNIYHSVYQDTIWSVPTLLNEHMTSASDEIYPMLSPDGKSLFFASEGTASPKLAVRSEDRTSQTCGLSGCRSCSPHSLLRSNKIWFIHPL